MSKYLGERRTHGIRATYNAGCHCDDCRDAERRYKADYRYRVWYRTRFTNKTNKEGSR